MMGLRTWVLFTSALLTVAACGNDDGEAQPPSGSTAVVSQAANSVTSAAPEDVLLTAQISGRVGFDVDAHCYYLEAPDGTAVSVIWPNDASPAIDGSGIQVGTTLIPVGATVTGGGGSFSTQPVPTFDTRTPCLVGSKEVVIFNATGELAVGESIRP